MSGNGKSSISNVPVVQCLESSWGSFGHFWKLLKSSQLTGRSGPRTPPPQTQGVRFFPSLLVKPECIGESRSARRRARRRDRDEAWGYAEIVWAYFTFLDGGSPHKSSEQQRFLVRASHTPWTSMHSSYAGSMHVEIKRYLRLQSNQEPLSRGISKINELIKVVKNSDYPSSSSVDKLSRVAKNVAPHRMSLPETAGIIDPKKFLKGPQLEAFEQMHSSVPHGVEPLAPTKGCFKVQPEDLKAVNHKLLKSGVATLIPEHMGLKDSRGRLITGGLFAVDHKPDSDRVILDRRPFNELERRLVWAKLPHGSLLTQLIVPPGFSVRGSGDDLSNYFYLLKHNEEWLPRNAVGIPFDGEGYEEFGGVKGQNYILSFRVVAMGDLNAVDISQQVHLEMLKDCHCMCDNEVLHFGGPIPASHTLEGLYIDDHIITQILPSKKHRQKSEVFRDEKLLDNSRAQYAKHSIPTSAKKAFSKADRYVAWGTEVDSKIGRVGTPQVKLSQLSQLIAAACNLKTVSKKLLQGVTGLLVHPFMHRRNLMCILQDTFIWIEKLSDTDSKPLPTAVREELLCCGLVLPLCHSNIRWGVSCRIGASDASLEKGGRAAALVSPSVAQTLYRFAEHRGEHIRLDWSNGSIEPTSEMKRAPSELEDIIRDLPWNATEICSFAHKQHINILETRMIYRELVDVVGKSTKPLRCVLLVDSRAAAGAWSKGRSSAKNLNRILRQSLGWSLAGQKTLHLVWVRSESNPADHPSRGKRIPPPPKVASNTTMSAFGPQLDKFRQRVSNRDIWREVQKDEFCTSAAPASPSQTHSSPVQKAEVNFCSKAVPEERVHPARDQWSFKEIFAGNAHLTRAFRQRKNFRVKQPIELMVRDRADANQDILKDAVFDRLCEEACYPKQLWHFGFPCGSFSILQNLNGGTRTKDQPMGNGSLRRENLGNKIMLRTIHLCQLLHAHGSLFTLENPKISLAWKTPPMKKLISDCHCNIVSFDQYRFGLRIPDLDGKLGLPRKPTSFVGTMPYLHLLEKHCDYTHEHVAVIGGVKY